MDKPRKKLRLRWILLVLVVLAALWGARGAFLRGPEVGITIETDRQAIGPGTEVTAIFEAGDWGLGDARLEVEQGSCTAVLAQTSTVRESPFRLLPAPEQARMELRALVGRENPGCLAEGDVILRAVADRAAGPLRGRVFSEKTLTLPAVFRPPSVQLLSTRHYVRQGGSGVVRFRVGDSAVRSGVRTGTREQVAYPIGEGEGARLALFGIPFDLADAAEVRLFAEDEAGNRAEIPFLNNFKASPPGRDTIRLPESFLQRVVPSIASQTPGFDSSGPLIDQYVRINRDMRVENRRFIAELSERSEPAVLWSGRFLQLENSAKRAGYAETRAYLYGGEQVDRQTHLGLDLASIAQAPVEAPNTGRVAFAGYLGIYGNAVILDHGYGMLSLCAHLSSIDVAEGDFVEKGALLGRTGATGLAGGDHLHLGIFIHGVAVDPIEWLDEAWIRNRIEPEIGALR